MDLSNLIVAVLAAAAMVVAVPVGLSGLRKDPITLAWQRIWPAAGAVGAVSLALPVGGLSAGLALFYVAATVLLALGVPLRLAQVRPLRSTEVAIAVAMVSPLLGSVALVLNRAGVEAAPGAAAVAISHLLGLSAGLRAATVADTGGPGARIGSAGIPLGALAAVASCWVDARAGQVAMLVAGLLVAVGGGCLFWLAARLPVTLIVSAGLLLAGAGLLDAPSGTDRAVGLPGLLVVAAAVLAGVAATRLRLTASPAPQPCSAQHAAAEGEACSKLRGDSCGTSACGGVCGSGLQRRSEVDGEAGVGGGSGPTVHPGR